MRIGLSRWKIENETFIYSRARDTTLSITMVLGTKSCLQSLVYMMLIAYTTDSSSKIAACRSINSVKNSNPELTSGDWSVLFLYSDRSAHTTKCTALSSVNFLFNHSVDCFSRNCWIILDRCVNRPVSV